MDISTLMVSPEGKTLEFKRDLSSPRPALRTITAFANTAGGTLVVGVEDAGSICGVADALALEERLANLVSDSISPRMVPDIDIISWRGANLVVVTVYPGPSRPYYLNAEGAELGAYIRVGSTNRRVDGAMRAELARSARGESFDEMLLPELDSEVVDFRVASESFAPLRTLKRRELESLRLLARRGDHLVPTVAGVLLFGSERLRAFPDAWLHAGRFKGVTRSHVIDSAELALPLPATVDAAMSFVKRNVALRYDIEDAARRFESWEYPMSAVREAVVNAIVHADYSQSGAPIQLSIFDDRLEIENPGLLLPGLTIEDVVQGFSRARNRVIARVFRELGLIEQWGSGIGRMFEACRTAGLPDPLLEEVGTHFRVTLFAQQTAPAHIDEVDARISHALAETPSGLSTRQVAERIGRTSRATRTRLKSLVEEGIVVEVGTGPNDPLRKYLLSEERAGYKARGK